MRENGPKSSSTDQPLLTAEGTSAVLHRDCSVTGLEQRLFLSSYDIRNADSVSGNVPDASLTMKSSMDDESEHCLAGSPGMTSVSKAPAVDSKGLEGTDIPFGRKPLQSYAESVAEESTEEFDDTEPFPGPQVTPVDVPCTAAPPTSHGGPPVDPTESIQTNHSAGNPLSTRSQASITRTPPTESLDVESAKYKRHGSGSKISRFYVATNGFCLAWDDLDASSLLDQFEDRICIITDCQLIALYCLKKNFGRRLDQFVVTANVIISNINAFLAGLGAHQGSCAKCYPGLANFTLQPFKVGILSLVKGGSSDLEDLSDILSNVYLWMWRFDDHCGGIVFYSEEYLTIRNLFALRHQSKLGLREGWAMPNRLRSSTSSMEGTYRRPSYFSLDNEGPTSPELLREIRCLAEKKRLESSIPGSECHERIGDYAMSLQRSESGGTEVSSDYSDGVRYRYSKN